MATGMEHAFIPRAEHERVMDDMKDRVVKVEDTNETIHDRLTTKVSLRLFLWVIGTIVGVLVVVFGVQLTKLDNLLSNTHSIELKVVAVQKDIEMLKKLKE